MSHYHGWKRLSSSACGLHDTCFRGQPPHSIPHSRRGYIDGHGPLLAPADALSLFASGISWRLVSQPGRYVSSLGRRLLSVSVAVGSPGISSGGTLHRAASVIPPAHLFLSESTHVSIWEGSGTTDTIPHGNRRVQSCPDSSVQGECACIQSHTPCTVSLTFSFFDVRVTAHHCLLTMTRHSLLLS